MKKIFFTMLLCGVITLGFTGCNKKEKIEIKNQQINSNRTIVVLLKHDVTSDDITRIKHEIEKIDSIENIVFKSKDELKEEMMNSSDTFNAILGDRNDNPLVDEFIITLEDIEKKEEIVNLIKNIDMVDEVVY